MRASVLIRSVQLLIWSVHIKCIENNRKRNDVGATRTKKILSWCRDRKNLILIIDYLEMRNGQIIDFSTEFKSVLIEYCFIRERWRSDSLIRFPRENSLQRAFTIHEKNRQLTFAELFIRLDVELHRWDRLAFFLNRTEGNRSQHWSPLWRKTYFTRTTPTGLFKTLQCLPIVILKVSDRADHHGKLP